MHFIVVVLLKRTSYNKETKREAENERAENERKQNRDKKANTADSAQTQKFAQRLLSEQDESVSTKQSMIN